MDVGVDAYNYIRKKDDNILQIIPFNSARKRACTVIKHPDDENLVRVFVKGAPEIVLDYCETYFDQNGEVQELDDDKKDSLMTDIVK